MLSLYRQMKSALEPDAASHSLTQSISFNQNHTLQKTPNNSLVIFPETMNQSKTIRE